MKQKTKYLKPILIAGYILLIFMTWQNIKDAFSMLQSDAATNANTIARIEVTSVIATILILLLAVATKYLNTVPKGDKVQKGLSKIGLKNEEGQLPSLVGRYPDQNKKDGLIYEFKGNNLSLNDFNRQTPRLETVLEAKISGYEYGENSTKKILVHATPMNLVRPNQFNFSDCFLHDVINMLVVGATGTGKSYFLKILLGKIALHIPNVSITICDFKKNSFAMFAQKDNFYGYEDVPKGIRKFYQEFQSRLKGNKQEHNNRIKVLLIDEYGALISSLDKKEAEEIKSMIAEMLFMGRSLGIRVIIGVQRADAEYFKSGARDQFRIILALGNLSKEQKQMLFMDYKDKMTDNNGLGEGYLFIDGQQDIEHIKVDKLEDYQECIIHRCITEAMSR